jgi:hypothetical protein
MTFSYLRAIRTSVSCAHFISSELRLNGVEIAISNCTHCIEGTEDSYKRINNAHSPILICLFVGLKKNVEYYSMRNCTICILG